MDEDLGRFTRLAKDHGYSLDNCLKLGDTVMSFKPDYKEGEFLGIRGYLYHCKEITNPKITTFSDWLNYRQGYKDLERENIELVQGVALKRILRHGKETRTYGKGNRKYHESWEPGTKSNARNLFPWLYDLIHQHDFTRMSSCYIQGDGTIHLHAQYGTSRNGKEYHCAAFTPADATTIRAVAQHWDTIADSFVEVTHHGNAWFHQSYVHYPSGKKEKVTDFVEYAPGPSVDDMFPSTGCLYRDGFPVTQHYSVGGLEFSLSRLSMRIRNLQGEEVGLMGVSAENAIAVLEYFNSDFKEKFETLKNKI